MDKGDKGNKGDKEQGKNKQQTTMKNQHRVSLFVPSLGGGGAERVMLNLAQGFAERGLAVDLVLAQVEGPYLDQVSPKVRVVDLKAPRVLLSLPALIRYLRQECPVALLCAMHHTNIVALWAKLLSGVSTRVVATVHNTSSSVSLNSSPRRAQLMPLLMRLFYPWADRIVTVSEGVADNLAQMANLPRQRIQVIYNPVVTPELFAKAQAPLDHPWFRLGEPPVILGVGRLTKQKDFPTLIKAFAIVRQSCPARLVILGEGEDRLKLEALVKEIGLEGAVSMPGFLENPYVYMAKASVVVLSSAWEGFGNVIAEAMACGTPVVSTDCKSGPAEILENGKYGELVPVGDVEELARAIARTLQNPQCSQTLQNRAAEFSQEKIINQYLELLETVI